MNIKHHKEILPLTTEIQITRNYVIRKFIDDSGNYLIIDIYGDFLVLDKSAAGDLLSAIWHDNSTVEDVYPTFLN